ncbi:ABC transporter ATP-binding protein [Paracraurococcus lichenis]|uniref:ABC transporter ATP-binding protein n=1 Tax=Paracraurococcus lichenis TaxID=3064888 RepID=A0ABT9E9P5_9PROT|nr:ABC transporter ATP-binding protein [Paracraurococcus sp. LOR1-02]MDO9712650.1 ABC transporter ATP-binding protein [Paracraurococcus sp. LOR1-02]
MTELALEVRGLDLTLDPDGRRLHVVRNLDLELRRGEVLGLIGESGSGKTMTGMSLLRLEPEGARLTAEVMRAGEADLLHATESRLRALRGSAVGMIFQDPVGAFNPAKRIAWHAQKVLGRRGITDWRPAAERLLADVDIADSARVLGSYPHQLSGGMLQRALIALVLAANPAVVVADEPTTNLDNIVERQILRLFRRLRRTENAAFLFITHDMTVAASLCDRIAVMYAGEVIEIGTTAQLFENPGHPYTMALIATARALEGGTERLPELPGEPPSIAAPRSGCAFSSRCPRRMAACTRAPIPMIALEGERRVRCLLHG